MRVHEIAKELGRPSREVIAILNSLGIPVISHANIVDDVAVEKLKSYYTAKGLYGGPEPEPEPQEEVPVVTPSEMREEVPVVTPSERSQEIPIDISKEVIEAPAVPEPPIPSLNISAEPAPHQVESEAVKEVESIDLPLVETPQDTLKDAQASSEATEISVPVEPMIEPSKETPQPSTEELKAPAEAPKPPPPPQERPRRPRSFRVELERARQRRDYVNVPVHASKSTQRSRGSGQFKDFAQPQERRPMPADSALLPPPPVKQQRKRMKKEDKERIREERERAMAEYHRKKIEALSIPLVTGKPQEITVPEGLTVKELAQRLSVKAKHILSILLGKGHIMTINQIVPPPLAEDIARELGYIPKTVTMEDDLLSAEAGEDRPEERINRAPVVTVMGHVDHGKTTLLDRIRQTNIAAQEAGGITQKIGAYQVEVHNRKITFIDTPGHEAFTQMRARGAKATDVVILVVAADDGVMPQTLEAINHARAAGTPIVVAINKIDKPNADPERVKRELAEAGLVVEEWGGDTVAVPIAAKKGEGIEELLDMVLLVADLLELKANPTLPAHGIILESRLDPRRGALATVLIQNGTLKLGDVFVAGSSWGRVRAMLDDKGQRVNAAPPSIPVEILGFEELPQAGDLFQVIQEEAKARQIASMRRQTRIETERKEARIRLDAVYEKVQAGAIQELSIILKTDSQGSLEALRQSLQELSTEQVHLTVLHSGIGGITTSDVMLAAASNAIILGFNVRADRMAREQAEAESVEIRYYNVIYDATEDIRAALKGMVKPTKIEKILGTAEVRQIFHIKGVGTVGGCYVRDGKIVRGVKVRLLRDNVVIHTDSIVSLKRFKDDVQEVTHGYECGITLGSYQDIKMGDILEAFVMEEVISS